MKVEAWVMIACAIFFALVSPAYWIMSEDPTGTTALIMAFLLSGLMSFYLVVVARQIPERPEDKKLGEVAEGAGEQGFFPPYSWWPLFAALNFLVIMLGLIFGWWLFILALGFGLITVCGWVFEYYRGIHAH